MHYAEPSKRTTAIRHVGQPCSEVGLCCSLWWWDALSVYTPACYQMGLSGILDNSTWHCVLARMAIYRYIYIYIWNVSCVFLYCSYDNTILNKTRSMMLCHDMTSGTCHGTHQPILCMHQSGTCQGTHKPILYMHQSSTCPGAHQPTSCMHQSDPCRGTHKPMLCIYQSGEWQHRDTSFLIKT